jgi:hypothetical protein
MMPILLASGHAKLPERIGLGIPRLAKPFRRMNWRMRLRRSARQPVSPSTWRPSASPDDVPTGTPMMLCRLQAFAPASLFLHRLR